MPKSKTEPHYLDPKTGEHTRTELPPGCSETEEYDADGALLRRTLMAPHATTGMYVLAEWTRPTNRTT